MPDEGKAFILGLIIGIVLSGIVTYKLVNNSSIGDKSSREGKFTKTRIFSVIHVDGEEKDYYWHYRDGEGTPYFEGGCIFSDHNKRNTVCCSIKRYTLNEIAFNPTLKSKIKEKTFSRTQSQKSEIAE